MLIHDARLLRDFIQIVETVLGVIIGGIRAEFEVRFNFWRDICRAICFYSVGTLVVN